MSDRRRFGGHLNTSSVAYGAGVRAPNLIPLPSGSIHRAPLKSAEIRKTTFEIAALIFAFLFVTVTGLGLSFAVFLLLFVKL
jgi:hypothetical protein